MQIDEKYKKLREEAEKKEEREEQKDSSLGASASVGAAGAPSVQVVDTSSARVVEAVERLNQNLEAGIRASVNIEGQDGLDRQWSRYQRLKNR